MKNKINNKLRVAIIAGSVLLVSVLTYAASRADSLAGSCSKGLSCTSPSCGQWSDLNNDGKCDRGSK